MFAPSNASALSNLDWQYYAYGGPYSFYAGDTSGSFAADGIDSDIFIGGATDYQYFAMSATAYQITIDYLELTETWESSAVSYDSEGLFIANGILFTETMDTITSVTIDSLTNMSGFSMSNITFTNDRIAINWSGLSFDPDTLVVLNVGGSAPVPEPATMLLLGSGLFGLAGVGRKKLFK